MAKVHGNRGIHGGPLPPDVQAAEDRRIARFLAGLPDASVTITVVDTGSQPAQGPDLIPVDIDTGSQPDPAARFLTQLTVRVGEEEWVLPVDHVDLPGGNRVRAWVRRPGPDAQPLPSAHERKEHPR